MLPSLQGEPVDLVLLGITLAGVDGLRICDALRASPATATLPVIRAARRRGGAAGGQAVLLLQYLVQHRGRVLSRDRLLSDVWGYHYTGGTVTAANQPGCGAVFTVELPG